MVEWIHGLVEPIALWIEITGVAVMIAGGLVATWFFVTDLLGEPTRKEAYHGYRANLGRAILLGLELLVAGDIIATVLVDTSLENVAALGAIVLIRTFLSFSLETEIEGSLPWKRNVPGRVDRERDAGA